MRLLLDTHTLLWFLGDDPALSVTARAAMEDPTHQKLVSIASCWEMAIKAGLNKLIAQAQIEGIPIVSVDVVFDPYGITRIW